MLTIIDPVHRAITMDDMRMEIAARCDRLVGRQRRRYCPQRAETITELQASFDALTRAVHPAGR
jgi:hypothetical protein